MRFLDMRYETARTAKFLLVALFFAVLAGCTPETDDDFSLPRDKYRGSWFCQDNEGIGIVGYNATISDDPSNSTQVLIHNYFKLEGTVYAIVTDETITVPNQKMQGVMGNHWCEGRGSLSKKGGTYTIYWKLYAAGDEEITSTYTKQ